MARLAIIGGGVTGAAAAYFLRARQDAFSSPLSIDLYESADRTGGRILSEYRDSVVLERGAECLSARDSSAFKLIEQLGLKLLRPAALPIGFKSGAVLETVDPAVLRPSLRGLKTLSSTRLLSTRGKFETALRVLQRGLRQQSNRETSLAEYLEQQWGKEAAHRVFAPIFSGIYGGNVAHLSSRLAERLQGSRRGGAIASIASGMTSLVTRFLDLSGARVRLNSQVNQLSRQSGQWVVDGLCYDAVISCIPAPQAAILLKPVQPKLAQLLASVRFSGIISVLLELESIDLPNATGCIMQCEEGLRAISFVSRKWAHAPAPTCFVRGFIGADQNLEDHELIALLVDEIEALCQVRPRICSARIDRWSPGSPQLSVGFEQLGSRLNSELKALPGLFVPESAYQGAGITDCIDAAGKTADLVIEHFKSNSFVGNQYEHRVCA